MMKLGRIILGLSLLTIATTHADAGSITISDLYNTGVDNGHNALAGGAADLHYSLGANPSGVTQPIVISPRPGSWVPNVSSPAAQWIGSSAGGVPNGQYIYTTGFTIGADALLSSILIEGRFTADDKITNVRLNGNDLNIGTTGDEIYGTWFNFQIAGSSYYHVGANTLSFVTENTHRSQNGLIVQMSGSYNAVPEPASIAMMGLGVGAALAFARRRIKAHA